MRKLMVMLLGASLVVGSAAVCFAQDTKEDTKKTEKKKKAGKKKKAKSRRKRNRQHKPARGQRAGVGRGISYPDLPSACVRTFPLSPTTKLNELQRGAVESGVMGRGSKSQHPSGRQGCQARVCPTGTLPQILLESWPRIDYRRRG